MHEESNKDGLLNCCYRALSHEIRDSSVAMVEKLVMA